MEEVICAISTPLGRGAISIVRMSGKGSLQIMQKVFSSKNLDYKNTVPRMLYYGSLNLDKSIEKCLAVYFKAPNSYTGEDMVEFQVHGGSLITQKVLEILMQNGARLAENGEFSRRAFENGKISLDMAEGIMDEINAESESEMRAALSLADGRLKNVVNELQKKLTNTLAQIEATLDYPEEDFEEDAKNDIKKTIFDVKNEILTLLSGAKYQKIIKNGTNIAIVGAPNVGKSSLLNALLGEERAIVTDIEGTTRDTLSESINYKGVRFNFVDTAGIRESDDFVEKIGIEKAKKSIESCDVVLLVLDGSRALNNFDKQILELLAGRKNVIKIVNKTDKKRLLEKFDDEIEISALSGKNVETIKDAIYDKLIDEDIDYSKQIITSSRQIEALEESLKIAEEIEKLPKTESMDIVAMLIKSLWNALGKITGQCENENIIDLIFSKFCLGK